MAVYWHLIRDLDSWGGGRAYSSGSLLWSSLGLCLALVHRGKVTREVAEAVHNLGKEHWVEELAAGMKGTRINVCESDPPIRTRRLPYLGEDAHDDGDDALVADHKAARAVEDDVRWRALTSG